MINKRRRVPATVEFGMRCALVARNRWRSDQPHAGPSGPYSAPVAQPVEASTGVLHGLLNRLGIQRGDTLIVHSTAAAVERLGWAPSDFLDLLQEHLGRDGTLVMPSHPKLKLLDGGEVYDVRRSPSQVGLLTELFRRRPSVARSKFPFSSAAAAGPNAEYLLDEHIESFAPHDEKSPYAKLAEIDGKCLCIGCPLDRMTILHVAEDSLRNELGIPHFHTERQAMVKGPETLRQVAAHTRAPWLWWYLHLFGWTSRMYRRGLAWDLTFHDIAFRRADARPTIHWMQDEVRRGRSIYPLAWLNQWIRLADPQLKLQS